MQKEVVDFDSPEGRELLRSLYAFSRGLFRMLYKTDVNERGKSFKDYVHDAIEKHLMEEDHYDPDKSPIDYHLKYNVIRRAIYNDLPASVKKKHKELRENLVPESNLSPKWSPVSEPSGEAIILELLESDQKLIFEMIEKRINGDDILELIYLAVCHDRFELSQRSEISQEYKMSLPDFDNGKRRFKTIIKSVYRDLKLI